MNILVQEALKINILVQEALRVNILVQEALKINILEQEALQLNVQVCCTGEDGIGGMIQSFNSFFGKPMFQHLCFLISQ